MASSHTFRFPPAQAPIQSSDDVARVIEVGMEDGGVLLTEADFAPAFFDLKTGLAGALFQKCANYDVALAIVMPDAAAHGPRFAELAREHRTHPTVRFFATAEAAAAWLSSRRAQA